MSEPFMTPEGFESFTNGIWWVSTIGFAPLVVGPVINIVRTIFNYKDKRMRWVRMFISTFVLLLMACVIKFIPEMIWASLDTINAHPTWFIISLIIQIVAGIALYASSMGSANEASDTLGDGAFGLHGALKDYHRELESYDEQKRRLHSYFNNQFETK